ncbi:hypothetical protein C0991_007572 [Blastosporella zonata]|nr:hypothetical protein C0991_007572 [Blastosporella zonata]
MKSRGNQILKGARSLLDDGAISSAIGHPVRSVKKTWPTCETVPDNPDDVWIIKLMWFALDDVYPGKIVWNSAIPVEEEVKAPRRKVDPYFPSALAVEHSGSRLTAKKMLLTRPNLDHDIGKRLACRNIQNTNIES